MQALQWDCLPFLQQVSFHNNTYELIEILTEFIFYLMISYTMYRALLTTAAGWYVLSLHWMLDIPGTELTIKPWRLLFFVYTIPTLIGAFWLMILPESPKFYLSRGRESEAFEILLRLYLENHPHAALDDFAVKHIAPEAGQKDRSTSLKRTGSCWKVACSVWNQTVPLFQKQNVINFVICCVVQFGLFVV